MFTLATLCRALISEALRDGEPFEGEGEGALPCGYHSREGRGHLGSQGEVPVALVLEEVDLLLDFLAALAFEKVE